MPSEPTVAEVRELLHEVKNAASGRMLTSYEAATVASLCRHFLASQQPMTAGEFAGLVIAEFSKSHYREAISERMIELASEHNIIIVEAKK